MPWVRIDEKALTHPKIAVLKDAAFRLWVASLVHCQQHLTDGLLRRPILRCLQCYSSARAGELLKAGLWDADDEGYRVHDYLHWNESREKVLADREWSKQRRELFSNPALLAAVRQRDGNICRYCGKTVNWKDRRGPDGGTYDHVIARGPNSLENLVVACRGCNSSKADRPFEQCGMVLRPALNLVPNLNPNQNESSPRASDVLCSGDSLMPQGREGGAGETNPPDRVRDFIEWYSEAHERFVGVGYLASSHKDYMSACQLCEKFTDQELRDAALVWFGQDDDFATNGTRTLTKFLSRASACVLTAKKAAQRFSA